MRPQSGLTEALLSLPFSGRIFGRHVPDFEDVATWPTLLVLALAPLQVVRDAAMYDLVAYLEVVLVRVSRITRHAQTPSIDSRVIDPRLFVSLR